MTEKDAVADSVEEVVRIMRLLADPTRLRLLTLLRGSELNVTSICRHLKLAQPTVSHHLGLLRTVGLVTNRREGKQVFYATNPEAVEELNRHGGLAIESGPVKLQVEATPIVETKPAATREFIQS